jgi:hypothetical protein
MLHVAILRSGRGVVFSYIIRLSWVISGVCSWVQSAAFPQDRPEGLGRENGDTFVGLK